MQREEALEYGNRHRSARAEDRHALQDGSKTLVDLIIGPAPQWESAMVVEMILLLKRRKAMRPILARLTHSDPVKRVELTRTVGQLTDRERKLVIEAIDPPPPPTPPMIKPSKPRIPTPKDRLDEREARALEFIARGMNETEAARRAGIKRSTLQARRIARARRARREAA